MPRFNKLTLLLIIALPSNIYSQGFYDLTSKIFFNVDVKRYDVGILSDLKLKSELTLKKDTGWSVYPPTDDDGGLLPFHNYAFSKHPYFVFDFNNGQFLVMTSKDADRIIGLTLSISFKSKLTFDSTYKSIKKLYSRYSSKTIKRPTIAQPYEVTKYLSKHDSDYVIITKGENNNKPYIHIAYNYQDYKW